MWLNKRKLTLQHQFIIRYKCHEKDMINIWCQPLITINDHQKYQLLDYVLYLQQLTTLTLCLYIFILEMREIYRSAEVTSASVFNLETLLRIVLVKYCRIIQRWKSRNLSWVSEVDVNELFSLFLILLMMPTKNWHLSVVDKLNCVLTTSQLQLPSSSKTKTCKNNEKFLWKYWTRNISLNKEVPTLSDSRFLFSNFPNLFVCWSGSTAQCVERFIIISDIIVRW